MRGETWVTRSPAVSTRANTLQPSDFDSLFAMSSEMAREPSPISQTKLIRSPPRRSRVFTDLQEVHRISEDPN